MLKVSQPLLTIAVESDTYLLLSNVTRVLMPDTVPFDDHRIFVEIMQSGAGSYTITGWPSNVRWVGNQQPTVAIGDSAITVLSFLTFDRGASWIGDARNITQSDSVLGDINAALEAILQPET